MKSHAFLAAGAMAFALAACSGETPDAPDSAATDAAMPAPTSAPTAGPAADASPAPEASASATPTSTPTASASAKPTAAATPAAAPAVAASAPPVSWARCAICHDASKGGADKLGPNLWGTYGAKAAQGSFAFSDALKASGLTWDEATLHQWIENPRAKVPGNRMSFPGIKDAAKRQEIIDYLKKQR